MDKADTITQAELDSIRPSYKEIWRLAWPGIVSNAIIAGVGLSYIKMLAHLGPDAIAAISAGHRIFMLMQALLLGISVAATVAVSHTWGRGERDQSEFWTWQSLYLGFTIATVSAVLGIVYSDEIASIFGLTGAAAEQLSSYTRIVVFFNFFHTIGALLAAAFRASGDSNTPMRFILVNTILNLLLSYMLINGSLGLPALGVDGAAWGGGIAPLLAFSIFALRWEKNRYILTGSARPPVSMEAWRKLINIAVPATGEQLVMHGGIAVFMLMVADYGVVAFGAFGAALSMLAIVVVIGMAFSMAATTLGGQALGAGNGHVLGSIAMRSLALSMIFMLVLSSLFIVYAQSMSFWLVADPETAALCANFIRILAFVLPLVAAESVFLGMLRGSGATGFVFRLSASALILRLIVCFYLLTERYSVEALFATVYIQFLPTTLIGGWRLYRLSRASHGSSENIT